MWGSEGDCTIERPVFVKQIATELLTADFHYDLPPDRIAASPAPARDDSRLLVMRRGDDSANDHGHFRDLGRFLPPRSLLVLNDARVIAARLRGHKATGGAFELLLLRPAPEAGGPPAPPPPVGEVDERWEALGRSLGNVTLGTTLLV